MCYNGYAPKREACLIMIAKKRLKPNFWKAVFGLFFAIMGIFALGNTTFVNSVYAEPDTQTNEETSVEVPEENAENDGNEVEPSEETDNEEEAKPEEEKKVSTDKCQASLGALGWLVCPTTGKIAEAVDWLYDKIEQILIINPVSSEDGSPIYEIWKYCRGVTNIVFIIFLLVVIYSQITGLGINNYGIKKALPKLIVAAVLVNISFFICSAAVDISNVVGNSLRGLFSSIAETAVTTEIPVNPGDVSVEGKVASAKMYSALSGTAALTIGGVGIAFETGAIWMLIPVMLGAIVAVVTGLITIALRQAVVALLVMISPLAMVANILPNTEQWFKKWKDLLYKMLIFYPMFSLLFGASNLAGFAIIASSNGDGFWVLLGTAVQIFPLFFSWSLMKMSGTFLGTINAKLRGLAAGPLATNRAWAESHRQLTKRRMLASSRAYTPSARLMQFLSDRRIAREAEISEKDEIIKNRGLAYHAGSHYRGDGSISKKGESAYEGQARNMAYQRAILRDKNNYERGLGGLENGYRNAAQRARLTALDKMNVDESDALKAERARGALIEYENAQGFFERVQKAQFANDDQRALDANNTRHQLHPGVLQDNSNIERYMRMRQIFDGDMNGIQEVLADAASSINAQAQIRRNKFQVAADLTPASQNIADHINDLIQSQNAIKNIDAIVGGLRILNMRGDTDIVAKQLSHGLVETLYDRVRENKLELGTYATQVIANYSMFDVKDRDPIIRRFGKYLNMQTAAMYNDDEPGKRRKRKDVSWWEYINSQYVEVDDNGNPAHDENGNIIIKKTKGMRELMAGTSYKGVEKTAFKSQIASIRDTAYDIDQNGELSNNFSLDRFIDNEKALWNTIMPNLIGDHLSYLSGSEQVMTLRKTLLFVDPKTNKFDWEGAFGKEIADGLTTDDKIKYINSLKERVKSFYGGQVPVQISRSKSDMLAGVKNLYALLSYVEDENGEIDPEKLNYLEENTFGDGANNALGNYKEFESQQIEGIKKRFVGSLDPKALEGFVKMYRKGYQGEAKKALLELIGAEILDGNNTGNTSRNSSRSRRQPQPRRVDDEDNEEDDGPSIDSIVDDENSGFTYSELRSDIEEIYRNYAGSDASNISAFWNEVKNIVASSPESNTYDTAISEIEDSLPQYTDVAAFYVDVINRLFGGFGD